MIQPFFFFGQGPGMILSINMFDFTLSADLTPADVLFVFSVVRAAV